MKLNVKYARNKLIGASKGQIVTDKNSFHTFNIEFKDDTAVEGELFELKLINGKNKDLIEVEVMVKEDSSSNKASKTMGLVKISVSDLLEA